jgi:energy-coupling factor transporter ATP-binding protein EcfA2
MLSGGEQQRVTIARALANRPDLLLLDEPTGDLDSLNTNNVMKILVDLHKKGKTLVMVTHDMNLVNYGTRVVFMRDGKIVGERSVAPTDRADKIEELEAQIHLGRDGRRDNDDLAAAHPASRTSLADPPHGTTQPAAGVHPSSLPFLHHDESFTSGPLDALDDDEEHSEPGEEPLAPPPSLAAKVTSGRDDPLPPGFKEACAPHKSVVREPGDYEPVYFADPELAQAQGYEVRWKAKKKKLVKRTPMNENPYSNLRSAVIMRRNRLRAVPESPVSMFQAVPEYGKDESDAPLTATHPRTSARLHVAQDRTPSPTPSHTSTPPASHLSLPSVSCVISSSPPP